MRREVIKWPRVERDLTEHFSYIAKDKVAPALRLLEVAEESFEKLAEMPAIGLEWRSKQRHLRGLRYYPMPAPYRNYVIFYRATAREIEIVAVLHGARDLENRVGEIFD